jgi:hypothetical protein
MAIPVVAAYSAGKAVVGVGTSVVNTFSSLFGNSKDYKIGQQYQDAYWYTLRQFGNPNNWAKLPKSVQDEYLAMNWSNTKQFEGKGKNAMQLAFETLEAKIKQWSVQSGYDLTALITTDTAPRLLPEQPQNSAVVGSGVNLAGVGVKMNQKILGIPLWALIGAGVLAFVLFRKKG